MEVTGVGGGLSSKRNYRCGSFTTGRAWRDGEMRVLG